MRAAAWLLVAACSSAPPRVAPRPAPADASVVAVAAIDAAPPDPCAQAFDEISGNAEPTPIAYDAQDFVPTAAERVAIARAAKATDTALYEGGEQQRIARAYDRWIADGAAFEVKQAIAQPRALVVTFPFDGDIPSIDRGDRLMVIVEDGRDWRAVGPFYFDPDARIVGVVDRDRDGAPELIFVTLHDATRLTVWRIDTTRFGDDPRAPLVQAADCD